VFKVKPDKLTGRGLSQADVVLAMLRDGRPACLDLVEELVGRRIKRYPPRPSARPWPVVPREQVFVRVLLPAKTAGKKRAAWGEQRRAFRVGRTVSRFLKEGGTRRLLARALREGWVELG
jgi:hypothetical protein